MNSHAAGAYAAGCLSMTTAGKGKPSQPTEQPALLNKVRVTSSNTCLRSSQSRVTNATPTAHVRGEHSRQDTDYTHCCCRHTADTTSHINTNSAIRSCCCACCMPADAAAAPAALAACTPAAEPAATSHKLLPALRISGLAHQQTLFHKL
jgi:hypothetical protein